MSIEIKKAVARMYRLYDKEIQDDVLDMFVGCLNGYEEKEIKIAMGKAAQVCKFCPKPADIIEQLKPSVSDWNVKSLEAIGCLQRAIESENMDYIQHDPVLLHMAHSERRLEQLGQMTKTEFQFYLNRCRKDYIELSSSEQGMKALELKQRPTVLIQDVLNDIKDLEESK